MSAFTPPSVDDLIALALEAAREIVRVREAGFETQTKHDKSPVTIADQRAEAVIEAGLARLAPGVPMLGEESVAEGRIPDTSGRFFCVDPLDGTQGFVRGSDEFTVNIALIENGAPVLGVIVAPVSGETYAGSPEGALKGVYDVKAGVLVKPLAPIHAAPARPGAGWRVFASRNTGKNSRTTHFLEALGPHENHLASSSIKFCRVAEASADIYPRFGEVSEWDAAAGHAILAAAGGGVMDFHGQALTYGAREKNFLVRGLVAYANEEAKAASMLAIAAAPPV